VKNAEPRQPVKFARRPGRGIRLLPALCWAAVALATPRLASCWAAASPAYPLKVSPGQHYLVDQNNVPFFIQGDSPWYIIQRLNAADVDTYLSTRSAQGFNSIILDLQSHKFGSGGGTYPCANIYGQIPFTGVLGGNTNFLTYNENYYTNADYVIQRAAYYGICVFLFPLYAGYQGGDEGWYRDMLGNGSNSVYQFAQFVGNRYKNQPNIVWIGGGDFQMPSMDLADAVMNGVLSQDSNHICTAHAGRTVSALDYYSRPWCTLNSTYTRTISYSKALTDYGRLPVAPTFLLESYYEPGVTALACRQEAWGAITYGCAGHFYGNDSLWPFSDGWQGLLTSTAATTITNIVTLMATRPWHNCVPDFDHTLVTSGYGTAGQTDYLTAMREADGKTAIIYFPQGTMVPTVDLTRISGSTAIAWWYNPRTGAATAIGTYSTTGTRTFTPPDASDWVLVVDDASQHYRAPGATRSLAVNGVTIQRYGAQGVRVSVANLLSSVLDPNGDAMQLISIQEPTPGGATVEINGDWILYTPPAGSTDAGSFTYTVNDQHGLFGTGTVTITVANHPALTTVGVPAVVGEHIQVSYYAIPNWLYVVQYTDDLNNPWQPLPGVPTTADSLGILSFEDTIPTGPSMRYYRVVSAQ
jgi:hypothetical protein